MQSKEEISKPVSNLPRFAPPKLMKGASIRGEIKLEKNSTETLPFEGEFAVCDSDDETIQSSLLLEFSKDGMYSILSKDCKISKADIRKLDECVMVSSSSLLKILKEIDPDNRSFDNDFGESCLLSMTCQILLRSSKYLNEANSIKKVAISVAMKYYTRSDFKNTAELAYTLVALKMGGKRQELKNIAFPEYKRTDVLSRCADQWCKTFYNNGSNYVFTGTLLPTGQIEKICKNPTNKVRAVWSLLNFMTHIDLIECSYQLPMQINFKELNTEQLERRQLYLFTLKQESRLPCAFLKTPDLYGEILYGLYRLGGIPKESLSYHLEKVCNMMPEAGKLYTLQSLGQRGQYHAFFTFIFGACIIKLSLPK